MKNILLPVALLAATHTIAAENTATKSTEKKPEEMMVTGTRSEQPSIELPASIQIVTEQDIKLSGAQSVADILGSQAGIQINTYSNPRNSFVSMRGYGPNAINNVLIMINGRKLNNPTLQAPDLTAINTKNIERIEIIQGSAGTLYGSQATGGVINIITKKAAELSGDISVSTGKDNAESYQGSVSQQLDNGFNYLISSEKSLSDNYRDNNQNEHTDYLINLGYADKNFNAFIEAGKVNDNQRYPGSISETQMHQDRTQTNTPNHYGNQDLATYSAGGQVHLNKNWDFTAIYTHRRDTINSEFYATNKQYTDVQTFEPKITGKINTANGDILLTAGYDYNDSTFTYETTSFYVSDKDNNQQTSDYYLQAIIPLTDSLKLTTGGRNSQIKYNNNFTSEDSTDSNDVYQIGLSYQLNDDVRLFIRRDEAFRWGSIDENALTLPTVDILKPQDDTSYEAGINYNHQDLSISTVIYKIDSNDEILFDATPYANLNYDKTERIGGVIDANWNVLPNLSLSANYSYVDATLEYGQYKGNTIPLVAEQTANMAVTYSISDAISLYVDAQYTGERYKGSDETNMADTIGGYTVFNTNVRWQGDNVYASARINNITGKEYTGYHSIYQVYPLAETTYEVTVGYSF
ncbi:TonB-dependent receptor [bacterium]|nr:TonB-dependent receptor [bacterium]